MHLLYARRALPHRGRNALHASTAYVADCEYSRNAGFEKLRLPRVWPSRRRQIRALQIRAGAHKALVIEGNTGIEPTGARQRPHHEKDVADLMRLRVFTGGFPGHVGELIL